jgi:hypothetical protein
MTNALHSQHGTTESPTITAPTVSTWKIASQYKPESQTVDELNRLMMKDPSRIMELAIANAQRIAGKPNL